MEHDISAPKKGSVDVFIVASKLSAMSKCWFQVSKFLLAVAAVALLATALAARVPAASPAQALVAGDRAGSGHSC